MRKISYGDIIIIATCNVALVDGGRIFKQLAMVGHWDDGSVDIRSDFGSIRAGGTKTVIQTFKNSIVSDVDIATRDYGTAR